ncbi:MAG: prolyl oligopeptidase family serine peptidase [Oscillospiraceae bacterium]|nr:prolyl oligopeptidase family serine peptidase [Oscillospiraceae bacterium]
MKKTCIVCILLALALLMIAGCTPAGDVQEGTETAAATPDGDRPGTPHALSGTIVVRGFEWGPGVNRVIFTFDQEIDGVFTEGAAITTSHFEREVTNVYLSDELGNAVSGASCYVTVEMVTNFDATGSPFETDMSTEHSVWADEHIVTASFTVWASGSYFTIQFEDDCIDNRVCPELERFTLRDSYTGDYENPLTGETETLTLNYAAYEPDSLTSWDKNPLIIWLHGRGEGGDDIERAILGNEVSALTETEIQSYFTSGDQTGAYVLVVQCPTYWLDGGDGTESRGGVSSRYTEILMDTIQAYIDQNSDVDTSRIYIMGASNGGYMTLEMLINYPDYFAAAVPCSEVYAYYVYARDDLGQYRTFYSQYIKTNEIYLTEDKIQALCQTPIWFVQAITDTLVPANEYTIPTYQALLQAGAENCWCSMYFDVAGTESSNTQYLGHWSWVYLFNNQVSLVQERDEILNAEDDFFSGFRPDPNGGTATVTDGDGSAYGSIFAWLNDQSL